MRAEFEEVAQATREGRHADALGLLLELFDLADRSPRDHGLVFMAMFQWEQLLEVYAPAREAMRRIRGQQAQRLLAGEQVFGDPADLWPRSRFMVIAGMDEKLKDDRATYDLFLQLRDMDVEMADREAFLALPAMVAAGDFALAAHYLGDPLAQLAQLNECARLRPLMPPANEPPRLAAELGNFLKEVRLLCAVHRGQQRPGEADALQTAALAGIESDDLRGWAVRELAEPGMLLRKVAARHSVAP